MAGGKTSSRQGGRTARMPATRFAHLQKKLRKAKSAGRGKSGKKK